MGGGGMGFTGQSTPMPAANPSTSSFGGASTPNAAAQAYQSGQPTGSSSGLPDWLTQMFGGTGSPSSTLQAPTAPGSPFAGMGDQPWMHSDANLGFPSLTPATLTPGAYLPSSVNNASPLSKLSLFDPSQMIPKPQAPAVAAPQAAAAPAAQNPQYTLIPMNARGGYNAPGMQQPMAVSDQWNGMTGSSQQMATGQVGGGWNPPQLASGPIYTDNQGGYFSKDPSGKIVPVGSGGGANNQFAGDYVKKFFQGWGYA
jgi:hypothetical protein